MKTLAAYLVLLGLGILTSFGQASRSTLDTDSTFRNALKEIKYPHSQSFAQKTTVVFVNFTINQQGKITNIKYPNENEIDNPFTAEVGRVLWHFPPQKPGYVGEYILPIIFGKERTQDENRKSSAQEVMTAYTRMFEQIARSLRPLPQLSEVYVPAYN
ncbi:hypothetical protein [Spirosoma endbachense]|uniref:TonB C-terminal domain-containing protein n=1 Tax=Spirosoma endbachense TaxID=2666025 RepID=A0A6P1VQ69_9BACT|nr:hypothetical protein [Spirosoma endbachense]QHV94568.1 hypothetical protein GJR95_05850 [Spirosoma endbachense]